MILAIVFLGYDLPSSSLILLTIVLIHLVFCIPAIDKWLTKTIPLIEKAKNLQFNPFYLLYLGLLTFFFYSQAFEMRRNGNLINYAFLFITQSLIILDITLSIFINSSKLKK